MDFYNTIRNTSLILKKRTPSKKGVATTALILLPNQMPRKKIYMKQPIYIMRVG